MCQEIFCLDRFLTLVIRFIKYSDLSIDRCTDHPIDRWTDHAIDRSNSNKHNKNIDLKNTSLQSPLMASSWPFESPAGGAVPPDPLRTCGAFTKNKETKGREEAKVILSLKA